MLTHTTAYTKTRAPPPPYLHVTRTITDNVCFLSHNTHSTPGTHVAPPWLVESSGTMDVSNERRSVVLVCKIVCVCARKGVGRKKEVHVAGGSYTQHSPHASRKIGRAGY